jgi:hypothetical protein
VKKTGDQKTFSGKVVARFCRVGEGDLRNCFGKLNNPGKPAFRRLGILPQQLRTTLCSSPEAGWHYSRFPSPPETENRPRPREAPVTPRGPWCNCVTSQVLEILVSSEEQAISIAWLHGLQYAAGRGVRARSRDAGTSSISFRQCVVLTVSTSRISRWVLNGFLRARRKRQLRMLAQASGSTVGLIVDVRGDGRAALVPTFHSSFT